MRRSLKSLAWLFTWFSALSGSFSVSGVTPIAAPGVNPIAAAGVLPHQPSNALLPTPKHNTALVVALDGTIYLMDTSSRKVLWSFQSGGSIYSSYQAPPDHDGDDIDASEQNGFFIDCGDDWGLYMHGPGYEGAKLTVGPEEIIKRTPIVSADGGVMIGSKNTTVFLVDAKSKRVIHAFSSDHSGIGSQSVEEKTILPKIGKDLMSSNSVDFEEVDQPLYIFRTDYALKYFSQKTGKDLWYLRFAEIKASFQSQEAGNHFGEFLSDTENGCDPQLNGDGQFSYDCQRTVDVYRIRDHSVLETLFLSGRLPNPHLGGESDYLPAPYVNAFLNPLDSLLGAYKNKEGMLALPRPEAKDLAIWTLPSRGASKMYTSVAPETSAWYHMYSALGGAILAAILLTPVLTFLKKSKLNKQSDDGKMPAVVSKKKKSRKSGITKSNAAIESSRKLASSENLVRNTTSAVEIPTTESFERKSVPNHLTPGDTGSIDGRKIGKLFITSKIIAKGSNGTVVFEGIYDGRPVAVKRLVQSHHGVALKEIQNLIASDCHPNIVRWYGVEYDQDFVYLSLERCACSMDDLIISGSISSPNHIMNKGQDPGFSNSYTVQLHSAMGSNMNLKLWKANGHPSVQLLKLMTEIVSGLVHLHDLGIVHRDLKPQNVLIVKERSTLHAKLSDMGISKRLPSNMSSLTQSVTGCGSSGWQAPEQLRNGRQTRAVDLFSLGCVLFFCLTGGQHPFGDSLERDINVVNNKKDLFVIEHMPEATDLITSLLEPDPDSRPKAVDISRHPLFWDAELRLSFLRDASDRVELEDREAESDLLKALEGIAPIALGGKWDEKMESAFINDIGKYRRYKYDSVRDLLRVVRNKLNHYRELSQEIRGILGQVPEGFNDYFASRFPRLLIEVHKVIGHYCGEEESLRKYFRSNGN